MLQSVLRGGRGILAMAVLVLGTAEAAGPPPGPSSWHVSVMRQLEAWDRLPA